MAKTITHRYKGILFIKTGKKWIDETGVVVKGKRFKSKLQRDYNRKIQREIIERKKV